jgi:cytosine/adenosine deaminase-related metal-dependent hydrolase
MTPAQSVKLIGARVTRNARIAERMDLVIRRDRIAPFGTSFRGGEMIDLSGYLLLPGLINAHDHLEFNLFPRLGRGPYGNSVEWAREVYHPEQPPVEEHIAVPKPVRLMWGGLKNLLSGATTVSHHNPYEARLFDRNFPVRVIRKFGWAHSLHFSPDLVERFRNTPPSRPFIVHAAEGRDAGAFSEIERLDAMGVLDRRTVLVHAIALKPSDIEILLARKCSIVWCPSSNLFAYGRTLTLHALASNVPIALGTDSALTADGDIADEIRAARSIQQISMERIFEMVTTRAAAIFRLPKASGEIQEHGPANLIAVADHGQTPADALNNLFPELVMIGGRIRLLSRAISARNLQRRLAGMQRISVQHSGERFVDIDVSLLHKATAAVLGPGFRLAGKCVSL